MVFAGGLHFPPLAMWLREEWARGDPWPRCKVAGHDWVIGRGLVLSQRVASMAKNDSPFLGQELGRLPKRRADGPRPFRGVFGFLRPEGPTRSSFLVWEIASTSMTKRAQVDEHSLLFLRLATKYDRAPKRMRLMVWKLYYPDPKKIAGGRSKSAMRNPSKRPRPRTDFRRSRESVILRISLGFGVACGLRNIDRNYGP